MLFRYVMFPFSLMSATFYGYDRVQAQLYQLQLKKQIFQAVSEQRTDFQYQPPIERVRIVLKEQRLKAQKRGEAFTFDLTSKPERINAHIETVYKTRISKFFGQPELPARLDIFFDVAQ
jgi:hypothetical protein